MNARTVVVVGAGAAGLTAALRAAESGAGVRLLNAHPKVGLKILMSGGTRCNVTHHHVDERDFHGGSRVFVRRVLAAFPAAKSRAWIESLGVALKLEKTGKLFPESDNAQTVLDALLGACERAGVKLEAGARVVRLERVADSSPPRYRLGIQRVGDSAAFGSGAVAAVGETRWPLPAVEPAEWIEADAVILATGGLSFPRTGSDGAGYALAASLGHTIVPPVPALTPLAASDPLCGRLQGVTLEVELTLRAEREAPGAAGGGRGGATGAGQRVAATRGSFLFTHFGYSGPAALDLSRHWHRAEGPGERAVSANFLPGETVESLREAWLAAAAADSQASVRRHLGARLPDRLVVALCGESGVESAAFLGQVGRERRESLLRVVTGRPLPVTGTLGYEKAEVTAGGVALDEVNPSTLESRKTPGLYLCGEILDVEGRLGGFNFQWAWSSGTVAGRGAGRIVLRVRQ